MNGLLCIFESSPSCWALLSALKGLALIDVPLRRYVAYTDSGRFAFSRRWKSKRKLRNLSDPFRVSSQFRYLLATLL